LACGSVKISTKRLILKGEKSGQVAKAPLRETLKHHWREVLIAAGLKVVETAPFYIFSTFVVSYATTTLTFQKSQALEAVTLGRWWRPS
jgi:hypothetical protein